MGLKYRPKKKSLKKKLTPFAVWFAGSALFFTVAMLMGASLRLSLSLPVLLLPFAFLAAKPDPEIEVSEDFIRDGRVVYERGQIKNPSFYETFKKGKLVDTGIKFMYYMEGREGVHLLSTIRFDPELRSKIHRLVMKLIPFEKEEAPAEPGRLFRIKFWRWATEDQAVFMPVLILLVSLMLGYNLAYWNDPTKLEFEYLTIKTTPVALALYFFIQFARWLWLSRNVIKADDKGICLASRFGAKPLIKINYSEIIQCEEYTTASNFLGRQHTLRFQLTSGEYQPFQIGGYENEGEIVQLFRENAGKY